MWSCFCLRGYSLCRRGYNPHGACYALNASAVPVGGVLSSTPKQGESLPKVAPFDKVCMVSTLLQFLFMAFLRPSGPARCLPSSPSEEVVRVEPSNPNLTRERCLTSIFRILSEGYLLIPATLPFLDTLHILTQRNFPPRRCTLCRHSFEQDVEGFRPLLQGWSFVKPRLYTVTYYL